MSYTSREIHLVRYPTATPDPRDFEIANVEMDEQPGKVLVRNHWMSVDPYMRGRMRPRKSYITPFELGRALGGDAIGKVVHSSDPRFSAGDTVKSFYGWRELFSAPAEELELLQLDGAIPEQTYLGALGLTGFTAYVGLITIGQLGGGETLLVSGAGGAVGSAACQIGKIKGCRVVGIAGSDEKCAWLKSLGADAAINYKSAASLTQAVHAAAPEGVDVYFDNVGGESLEAALDVARPYARFVECGMISQYNDENPAPGPRNLNNIVTKRLTLRGFIAPEFSDVRPAFRSEMEGWVREGLVQSRETVVHGIEHAVAAFLQLFRGDNVGKVLVRL